MLQKADFQRLFEYTIWANHRVLRAAALLSVDDFRRDMRSSLGGVRGTLVHTMGAEWIWLERFKGISPTRGFDEGEFRDVIAVRDRWVTIEEHRAAWLRSLKKDDPAEKVRYKNLAGQAYEEPLWQIVQHVANHSTYHRGQVVTMLRMLGSKPVATDMVVWDREREAKKKRG
jgi:uncharacterized damage-inducible protein DinB